MKDFAISFQNLENLNTMILNIYDNTLAFHTRISNFFRDIAPFIYFDRASVMIYYKNEKGNYQKQTSFTINWDTNLLRDYDSYYCKLDDTLAPLDRPEPTVIRSSSFFNTAIREQTEYWNGYMVPNNADFEIMANLLVEREQKFRACVSFTRGKGAGDFSDYHMRILRFIQPHLSRLAAEYIDQMNNQKSIYTIGDYNCIGYCILNDSCQIIKKNGSFDKLNLELNNRLLAKIVSLCMEFNYNEESPETLSYEYKLEDSPLFLELTRTPANLDGTKKQYCCLVYNLSHFFTVTLKQAKKNYQLSDKEYDILVQVLHGQKQEDIAAALFLSVPTVKKYVASIYNKLGITNQKQIYSKLHLL